MLEKRFDIPFIARLALREKQIQQNYRPVIAVHKWFARRPGTLFRGLLLAEFGDTPLQEAFFQSNHFPHRRIADPFMGGGTPLLEANRMGFDVMGFDINPMAYWIVRQEMAWLDLAVYRQEAEALRERLTQEIGGLYQTQCLHCGNEKAQVKYFLWVKTQPCSHCGHPIHLFPGYVVARNQRHPRHVLVCHACGGLAEVDDLKKPGACPHCGESLQVQGAARRGRVVCPTCQAPNHYPQANSGPPQHHLFALEYYCPICKATHSGRFFKKPDANDLRKLEAASARWQNLTPRFTPDDAIPTGDETNRLHRWGYQRYAEMFQTRQLLGLELAARYISQVADEPVRQALATNFSDLIRYQNMLCRYDPGALKSLDIFSLHGFPVGLVQAESNMLGIYEPHTHKPVGSGGWANIIEKFYKAKSYCQRPFEIRYEGKRKKTIFISGEWIGEHNDGGEKKHVALHCADAATTHLPAHSLDGVFTDPPYYGNVQYAELMDFLYVWLRQLLKKDVSAFAASSTRRSAELTANVDMGRGIEHFTEGLSAVFRNMTRALKPGAPLVFTYHHNDINAYLPVAAAILDAGLACTAALPAPAEMGASIHISGTQSSVVDTVFVSRTQGVVSKRTLVTAPQELAKLVREDMDALELGGVKVTEGDARCLTYGHLIRLAIWALRKKWPVDAPTQRKLALIKQWLQRFGSWKSVRTFLYAPEASRDEAQLILAFREPIGHYGEDDEISF